ncbi:MAG: alanine racemase [Candidatus Vogelbacteria bacterium CG10_big_fil_rev_8_21_14_0_10_51_16]|uniref:Alanine racemase n=1 Tax=Candidatus Vogelbacteria bacterium CG10_big_fil_rev_8_21_14_0_10_51_16 TaxID=1975045 RepID=A0A2H0REZ4_9BACT|nr:MAG: alanine racemase [Candidatus Vogelbacteria bacterium CG10_big_fil_rev_8_21_14_0_10_51_16]
MKTKQKDIAGKWEKTKKSLRPAGSRAWVEVDSSALRHNYDTFRDHLAFSARRLGAPRSAKLMAVVKSNAYGHGLIEYASIMEQFGADWLGVDTAVEGLLIRRVLKKIPILALGYTLPEKLPEAATRRISITVSNIEHLKILKQLSDQVAKLRVHIKVDTGMHRQGFLPEEIPAALKFFKQNLPQVIIEGVYTHFAAAKNPVMRDSVEKQFREFEKVLKVFEEQKLKVIRHACNSGATLIYPEAHLDMVRVGIALYGLWPEEATKRALQKRCQEPFAHSALRVSRQKVPDTFFALRPALSWKTVVGEVKRISERGCVGYDLTEAIPAGTRIAICPVGYWHGLFRAHSSVLDVLIRGKRAKLLGRVSMDMSIFDVSDIKNVRIGDEVTIIGADGAETISAEEVAALAGTSNYELVTRINPYTKRVYC